MHVVVLMIKVISNAPLDFADRASCFHFKDTVLPDFLSVLVFIESENVNFGIIDIVRIK